MTPLEQLPMFGPRLYDAIGGAYPATRRTEPRIAARIWDVFGDARTVLNVGAGTGSYEPADRDVTAVEPSAVMRALRPTGAAPCVAAAAARAWPQVTSARGFGRASVWGVQNCRHGAGRVPMMLDSF